MPSSTTPPSKRELSLLGPCQEMTSLTSLLPIRRRLLLGPLEIMLQGVESPSILEAFPNITAIKFNKAKNQCSLYWGKCWIHARRHRAKGFRAANAQCCASLAFAVSNEGGIE